MLKIFFVSLFFLMACSTVSTTKNDVRKLASETRIDSYKDFVNLWANPKTATEYFFSYHSGIDRKFVVTFEPYGDDRLRITRWWNEHNNPGNFKPDAPSGSMLESMDVSRIEVVEVSQRQITLAFISSGKLRRTYPWNGRQVLQDYTFEFFKNWSYSDIFQVMSFPLNRDGKIEASPAGIPNVSYEWAEAGAIMIAYKPQDSFQMDMPAPVFFNFNSCDSLGYIGQRLESKRRRFFCYDKYDSQWSFLAPASQINLALESQAAADIVMLGKTPCVEMNIELQKAHAAAQQLHYKIRDSIAQGSRIENLDYFNLVDRYSREKKELLKKYFSLRPKCTSELDLYELSMNRLLDDFNADEIRARGTFGK